MAIVKTKGTVIQMTISSVLASLAQVININKAEDKNEVHDADHLGNSSAGILMASSGRTTVGAISGEIFYDPADSSHQGFSALLATPSENAGKIILADSGSAEITYTSVGVGLGMAVALGDGLKAPFSIDLKDLPVWPSS